MDIARSGQKAARLKRRAGIAAGAGAAVVIVTIVLMSLKPAVPSVDRRSLWIGTVKKGSLECSVKGPGTLVPEDIRWIPAASNGRVDRILVQAGAAVSENTVLLTLINSDLVQEARTAEWRYREEEAQLADLRARLQSEEMNVRAAFTTAGADYEEAHLTAEANEALSKDGLVAGLTLKISEARRKEAQARKAFEERRLALAKESAEAQLAAEKAKVAQAGDLAALKKKQVEALKVRAGIDGVLQELPVEIGQRVATGAILAKVARPDRLKAEIEIAETQASDVRPGQHAVVDTHNALVPGHVVRVSPAVHDGTVSVEVDLDGPPPRGARPDQNVEGTIELAHLEDVLTVGRPAVGGEGSTVSLFRLVDGGKNAIRTTVKVGRTSVDAVQVLGGLKPGDKVILSDMSQYDAVNRVKIE